MVPIEQETNIEVLRQYALHWRDEAKRANAEVAQARKIEGLAAQQFLNARLKDQLSRLKTKFFGFGREELKPKKPRPVGHEQQELRIHGNRPHVETESARAEADRGKAPETADSGLPECIEHDFEAAGLSDENEVRDIAVKDPKEPWKKIESMAQETVEITITERTYKKVIHRQARYKLKDEYNTTGKEVIITAPGPAKLKAGCQYSIDFALAAVIPKIICDIQADFCAVHLDESRWPINNARDSDGQMWVMSNRIGSLYRFEPTRSGKVAVEMLRGYEGAAVTDGFSGYGRLPKELEKVRLGGCWAHGRREFYERIEDFPQAEEFVEMVDALYAIEDRAKTFDQLAKLRREESKPLIDRMHAWLWDVKRHYMPGDGIVAAANYCLNRWSALSLFLRDLTVPLDNNYAESALRHVVMGRKNFAGSKTIDGADVAATLYTVIESCKKVGLDPRDYLKYVITERWHKRDPQSPLERSLATFGKSQKVIYPEKSAWEIKAQ